MDSLPASSRSPVPTHRLAARLWRRLLLAALAALTLALVGCDFTVTRTEFIWVEEDAVEPIPGIPLLIEVGEITRFSEFDAEVLDVRVIDVGGDELTGISSMIVEESLAFSFDGEHLLELVTIESNLISPDRAEFAFYR